MQKNIDHLRQLWIFPTLPSRTGRNTENIYEKRIEPVLEKSRAFTLVEAAIATAVTVIVIAGTLSTFVYGLRAWQTESVKNEINMDLERAMERIRQDLRLSSVGIGLMAFYPANAAEYTAISFPMSTVDTNGLLMRESTGKIRWTQTVVYHVHPGSPDQFRRTVFSPRKTNATPAELYTQLQSVVQGTNTCLTGESVNEQVIFRNLVNLRIRPPEMQFDGYSPTYCKAQTVNWGSVVLSNGPHNLTFTIEGKNTNNTSASYDVGFDWFSLSPSASRREGEIYLPLNGHPISPYYSYSLSGGTVVAQDMSSNGATWSGNCQLTYRGVAVSNSITFAVPNDLWCDANFDNPPGIIVSNVSRKTDDSFIAFPPFIPDTVISMDKGTNWTAEGCTESMIGSVDVPNTTPAVINIIYGGTNPAAAITMNGEWVRVKFEAGTNGNLFIENAKISRQASGTNAVAGTTSDLYFGSGSNKKILAGSNAWSDWVSGYVIDQTNNYLVQFDLHTDAEVFNNARGWANSTVPFMSAMGGAATNLIIGVSALEVRYPASGLYRSGIFDTHIANPAYKTLKWTHVEYLAEGADIDIRVRSGNQPDLSDAGAWLETGYFQLCNGVNSLASLSPGRYVQYEALFGCAGLHTNSAILRDVTIAWDVPTGLVDLQVDFSKGPTYGIVSATVDGQSFIKGLEIEMEIFKQGTFGTVTAQGTMEVRPLNTNK
ncbi:MAG: hypothetical protein KKG09_06705 [Verrucomicrobia bacterium]|nr:hypothetical protein [Verrucomicrobiota bacterium]MCG2681015.1 hypothetical protein [Kiritimatiellia bacterium]MBU4247795.1 hypothetical protein [Verrucomicrobiota bacterium]MBU4292083.1 hypothetical protein [Verrucomicrobiota bacterium]MBU4428911.1 hypothetical protein [Verrucomicrobiota bacterium]